MGKSLFRFADALELAVVYAFCFFLNLLFNYVKVWDFNSYILKAFFKNFMDYQTLIVFFFTFIVIVFHYQMLYRKKIEVYCRVLVGDTVLYIAIRYIRDCLMVLTVIYLLFLLIHVHLKFCLTGNIFLVFIFIIYILISASQVRKYENF